MFREGRAVVFGVAFALNGTLANAPAVERTAFARLCEEVANSAAVSVDSYGMESAFERQRTAFMDGGPALNESIVTSVLEATGVAGKPKTLSARYRQIAGQTARELTRPVPGAAAMLQQLQSLAVPAAILTNGLSTAEQAKAHVLGFTGEVVVSEDTGVKTPDIRAFGALLDVLRLPAECVWYLSSDFEHDVRPSRTAGLHGVWLNPNGGPGSARSFDEFLDLVKEPYTRSLLGLRYILHNALAWRPGHFVPGEEYGLGE